MQKFWCQMQPSLHLLQRAMDGNVFPPIFNVSQATEFGEAEVWMNERLMRAAPGCFAEFLTAFEAEETTSKNKGPEPLWLIWQYEGDYNLWDLMQKKDFPYNLEQALLGRELDMPKGPQRKAVTISLVMQQVGCACLPL